MPATLKITSLHFSPYPSLSQLLLQHTQRARVIIITGGARGIGLSIAHAFAGAGALSVHLLGRTASTLQATRSDLRAQYTSCNIHTHVIDVADERSVKETFEGIEHVSIEESEKIRGFVLVHAAASFPTPEDLDQTSQEGRIGGREWWETFEINVKGTFLVFQAFSNLIRTALPRCTGRQTDGPAKSPPTTRGDEAIIVNLVSASAYAFTAPGTSSYAASKLAAMRVAECMAYEGTAKSYGPRIVNLHPGAVMTEMWEKSGGESVGIPCNDGKLCILHASSIALLQIWSGQGVAEREDYDCRENEELIFGSSLTLHTGYYVKPASSPSPLSLASFDFLPKARVFANIDLPLADLVPNFVLWLTMPVTQFLHGRTVEANWDIDELLDQKDLIVSENLLKTTLQGYPFNSAETWDAVVQKSLRNEMALHAGN